MNFKNNNNDDCGCGKPLKLNDPKRKIVIKKIINKKTNR
jgi:hypothetical protein